MPQSTVLIISDDPDFSRALTSRWQRERQVPNFITFGSNYVRSFPSPDFTIAIVGPVNSSDEFYRHNLLQSFAADNKPAIVVANSPDKGSHSSSAPTILTVPQTEGWIENVIALALLMLDRCEIESRLRQLEEIRNADSGHATLGHFMLEMRHTIANSLTTVLGNAELLLCEPAILSNAARFQLETIRNMGLRINEIMQRFSSLHAELSVVEQHEESSRAHAASHAG